MQFTLMGLKFDLAAIVFVGEPNSRGTVQRLSHVSARLFYSSEREGFEERKRRPEISISVFFFFFFFSLSLNCDSFFSLFLFLFSIFFFPSVNVMFPFEMVHPLLLFFVRDPPSFACSRTMSSHSTMFWKKREKKFKFGRGGNLTIFLGFDLIWLRIKPKLKTDKLK